MEFSNQSQRERLSYIDFMLYFLGQFNRSDLEKTFGIKEAAASRDISDYKKRAPKNLDYNAVEKHYFMLPSFKPLVNHRPLRALTQLTLGFGGISTGVSSGYLPNELPYSMNYPSQEILAPISRAIYQNLAVKIKYVSNSSGKTIRSIVPFALVNTGVRWHVRAFDRKRKRFADFVLTRIISSEVQESEILDEEKIDKDIQWNRIVELEIVPHPDKKHNEAVFSDFDFDDDEVLRINVRASIAGYLLRRLHIDCTKNHSMESAAYQLWLRNHAALYKVETLRIAPGVQPEDFD